MSDELGFLITMFPELILARDEDVKFVKSCVSQYIDATKIVDASQYGVYYDPIVNDIILLEHRDGESFMVRFDNDQGVKIDFPYKIPNCVEYIGELG